jgi:hypothetical protein
MWSQLRAFQRRAIGSARYRWALQRLRWLGIVRLLGDRPADAIPVSPVDMLLLYRSIRARRPKVVMEFGTGNSTLVIAEALRRNGAGHLLSVDTSRRWIGETEKNMPAQLRPFVTLHHSPCARDATDSEPCHRYLDLPDRPLDFLFLDGPDPGDVADWTGHPIASDPVHLEHRFNPGFRMLIDARKANTAFLKRRLKRSYRISEDRRFKLTILDLVQ